MVNSLRKCAEKSPPWVKLTERGKKLVIGTSTPTGAATKYFIVQIVADKNITLYLPFFIGLNLIHYILRMLFSCEFACI